MDYDINRPWLSLDPWQKEYIFDKEVVNNFLLTGRQVGKTTAMSMRAVELCVNHFKKGEYVLINSITEKQAYHLLAKAKVYAEQMYPNQIVTKGIEKPTKHKLMFKNGTGLLCYAAGEAGEGLRGFTIKKLMSDEGSRMSEEYYIAVSPMLSVIGGTKDIASTPFGKLHPDGTEKYFYKCSKDKKYKQYYINAEDCPRHSKEFLEDEKLRLSKLAYAQEYIATFTDELKRLFTDELIKQMCMLKTRDPLRPYTSYMGCDIAALGQDECTYELFERLDDDMIMQYANIVETKNLTTETTAKIIELHNKWKMVKIGVDDGGVGFGVWSELMCNDSTKRITVALNNASRKIGIDGKKHKKILKEEMYMKLLVLGEQGKVKLLNNDEVKSSLSSMQHDDGRIFGSNSHVSEGIVRGVWVASERQSLNIPISSFKL